jgi:hypothetical protein
MFFKKGKGALWVCIWNRGGGGPKKVWEPLIYSTGWFHSWLEASWDVKPQNTTA